MAAIPRTADSATQLCAYCNGTGKVPGSFLGVPTAQAFLQREFSLIRRNFL